jgi:endo-1,4-beta-xylanase
LSHVENYTGEFRGKVVRWDVINEAISNNELWQECGIELLADCYKVAKKNDERALLMYNDFGLL